VDKIKTLQTGVAVSKQTGVLLVGIVRISAVRASLKVGVLMLSRLPILAKVERCLK
jgi:hypothetical protein